MSVDTGIWCVEVHLDFDWYALGSDGEAVMLGCGHLLFYTYRFQYVVYSN